MTVGRFSRECTVEEFNKWGIFFKEENEKASESDSGEKRDSAETFSMLDALAADMK